MVVKVKVLLLVRMVKTGSVAVISYNFNVPNRTCFLLFLLLYLFSIVCGFSC